MPRAKSKAARARRSASDGGEALPLEIAVELLADKVSIHLISSVGVAYNLDSAIHSAAEVCTPNCCGDELRVYVANGVSGVAVSPACGRLALICGGTAGEPDAGQIAKPSRLRERNAVAVIGSSSIRGGAAYARRRSVTVPSRSVRVGMRTGGSTGEEVEQRLGGDFDEPAQAQDRGRPLLVVDESVGGGAADAEQRGSLG